MELTIKNDAVPVSTVQSRRAVDVYRFIAPFASIKSGFTHFFNGVPKLPDSVDSALHDAFIYFLSDGEDVGVVATLCNVTPEAVTRIIRGHEARKTGPKCYYRIYSRKLHDNVNTFFPKQYKELTIITDKQPEEVAEEIFRLLFEKTGIERQVIASNSSKADPVRCKTVLINLMYACFQKPKTSMLTSLIGCDPSGVFWHRHQHQKRRDQSVHREQKVVDYWKLYNEMFTELEAVLL